MMKKFLPTKWRPFEKFKNFKQESVFSLFFWIEKNVTKLFILTCFKYTKVYYTIVKGSSNSGL